MKIFKIYKIFCPNIGEISGRVVKFDKINLLRDIDINSGTICGRGSVDKSILVYRFAIGSTVGSYILYGLSKYGKAPKAIMCVDVDLLTLVGSILGNIPMFKIDEEFYNYISDGDIVKIEVSNLKICRCVVYR